MNLGYSKLNDPLFEVGLQTEGSSISSGSTSPLWSVDQTTGRIKPIAGLDLNGNDIVGVKSMLSANGTWSIGEDGKLVAQDLAVMGKATFGTSEHPQGITIYDRATQKPYCVGIENGEWFKTMGECGQSDFGSEVVSSDTDTLPPIESSVEDIENEVDAPPVETEEN